MHPSLIFDICLERYRECRLLSFKLGAINPAASAKQVTQRAPHARPTPATYVQDFQILGKRVLTRNPRWAPRLRLFELYYLEALPYMVVIRLLRVKMGTFDSWCHRIRNDVGRELAKSELWPPKKYFKESIRLRREREEQT